MDIIPLTSPESSFSNNDEVKKALSEMDAKVEEAFRDSKGRFKPRQSHIHGSIQGIGVIWQHYQTRAAYWATRSQEELISIVEDTKAFRKLSSYDALIVKQLVRSISEDPDLQVTALAIAERERLYDRNIGKASSLDVRLTGQIAHAHIGVQATSDWLSSFTEQPKTETP